MARRVRIVSNDKHLSRGSAERASLPWTSDSRFGLNKFGFMLDLLVFLTAS